MILGQVFERFVLKDTASHIEESPVSVMVRGLLETILYQPKKSISLYPLIELVQSCNRLDLQ